MYIDQLKVLVKEYKEFVNANEDCKDEDFLLLKEELWRVGVLIEMYESGGECMSFNIKEKATKLKNLYDNIIDSAENEL